jgi:hypothetical protein
MLLSFSSPMIFAERAIPAVLPVAVQHALFGAFSQRRHLS